MPKQVINKTSTTAPQEPIEAGSVLKKEGFEPLTVEALENLIIQDPEKAERYMSLFEKLKGYKSDRVREEGLIKTQIMILKSIQRQAEIDYQTQRGCEQHGHMREDNRSALVGQRDNFHEYILVCQRCQKTFHGIGEGAKQLPIHLASTLDTSLIGGVQ